MVIGQLVFFSFLDRSSSMKTAMTIPASLYSKMCVLCSAVSGTNYGSVKHLICLIGIAMEIIIDNVVHLIAARNGLVASIYL